MTYSLNSAYKESGGFTAEEQAAFNTLEEVVNNGVTRVSLRSGDDDERAEGVYDNYSLSIIDLDDMDKLGNKLGEKTSIGIMVHAIYEQYYGQNIEDNYDEAHNKGIERENQVSGISRPLMVLVNGSADLSASQTARATSIQDSSNKNYNISYTFIGNGMVHSEVIKNNNVIYTATERLKSNMIQSWNKPLPPNIGGNKPTLKKW